MTHTSFTSSVFALHPVKPFRPMEGLASRNVVSPDGSGVPLNVVLLVQTKSTGNARYVNSSLSSLLVYKKLTTNQCSGGKQLVGSGSNKKCVDQCPRGQYFAKTKCCPSSSTEQWDKSCKCDNSHQKLSQDGSKCIDKCPAGWNACATKCCPPGSSEKNGQCVVSRLMLS